MSAAAVKKVAKQQCLMAVGDNPPQSATVGEVASVLGNRATRVFHPDGSKVKKIRVILCPIKNDNDPVPRNACGKEVAVTPLSSDFVHLKGIRHPIDRTEGKVLPLGACSYENRHCPRNCHGRAVAQKK